MKSPNKRHSQNFLSVFTFFAVLSFLSLSQEPFERTYEIEAKRFASKSEQKSYPSDWAWLQRTYPFGRADKTAHLEAASQARAMRAEAAVKNQLLKQSHRINNNIAWEFAGPTNIGGRISDIEFNPQNPDIVYAGAATGGVFKSEDMGTTWTPIFDDQAILTIGDIAVDPVNPDIVYAGTGEANGGHNNFPGGGVYKTTDAGQTWQFIGLGETASIGRMLVDPANPQRVFVAAVGSYFQPNPERGVYRTDDGGATWSSVLFVSDSTGAIDLVMKPDNSSFILAAMWERVRRPNSSHLFGATSGIYRSTDGGDSWEQLTQGLPQGNNIGRIGLAMCQSQSNVAYALYTDGSNYLGLYKTTDSGDTWTDADPDNEVAQGTAGFSWYFGQIRVHPTDPDKLFAMDVRLMTSNDGSNNWQTISASGLHVDHHAMAFHPTNPDTIIEGNDGGINISTNKGASWTKVQSLPVTQFYEINIDPSNPERLYGGTQDNGTVRTLTGSTGDWNGILGGDGFYVTVDPTNSNIIYAETQFGGLFKSQNGGSQFFPVTSGISSSEPTNWATPVVMDPNNNLVLYYGTDRVYRTNTGAAVWSPISPDLSNGIPGTRLGTVTSIAVAPTNSNVIYAGTDEGNVWVTDDLGANWTKISNPLPLRWVTRVVVDPDDENIAYVTFSGLKWRDPQPHVFRTADMGVEWEDISGNLPDAPVNAFAVDPNDTRILYVGSDVGAYVTFDTGQEWQPLGLGLPLTSIYDLKIHEAEHFLVAGTHGRSMYRLELSQLTSISEPSPAIVEGFELHQNYPNPFNPSTNIRFAIPNAGGPAEVALTIHTVSGRLVRTLLNESKAPGSYTVSWDGTDSSGQRVASGIYFYHLKSDNFALSKKMILVK